MTDIIKVLRFYDRPLTDLAADEIERLRGEVDRLQSLSVTELCASNEGLQGYINEIEANFHHAKAERDAAVLAEREACAAICDNAERRKWTTFVEGGTCTGISAADCARAIRARGNV